MIFKFGGGPLKTRCTAILLQYSSVQLYVLTLQRVGNLLFFDKRDDSQFGEHVHTCSIH